MPPEEELSSENDDETQPFPLEKAMQFKQREGEDSLDEEDIPLVQLQRRIRAKIMP